MENIMDKFIRNQVKESYEIKQAIYTSLELLALLEEVSRRTIEAYKKGNKTFCNTFVGRKWQ